MLSQYQLGAAIDAIDFYCGIGGSSSGLLNAGIRVRLAANHDEDAINTHSANHPGVDHYLGDIQALDLRRLPRARILWASPICTEISPAGGKAKRTAQMDLWEAEGHVNTTSFERTRVTFWEVIRAAEIWRYDLVLIENVVEAASWELFDVWLKGMETLGYEVQFCSVSAAHIGDDEDGEKARNLRAPQLRDRLYMALRRKGIPALDLDPRPLAWCQVCDQDVTARQWWKPRRGQKVFSGRKIGKYGPQYVYVCPNPHRRDEPAIVEPYVAPFARAVDWSDLGVRIGDRDKPLSAETMRRIRYGVETIGSEPFVTMLRKNVHAHGVSQPARTITGTRNHYLTIPGTFMVKQFGGNLRTEHAVRTVDAPAPATVANSAPTLVIPYRKGSKAHGIDQPVSTQATRAQHGVLRTAVEVEDCHYRVISPRESATTQRFDPNYILTGSKGAQQLGAGNAVPVNVAQWIGGSAIKALGGAAA